MRDALIIFAGIILAIAIGGYLFLNGAPGEVAPPVVQNTLTLQEDSFVVLAEGADAGSLTRRTNYRITTDEQFAELWRMIYGQSGPVLPVVDFSRHEVIAVFDGSHSTGGFDVAVARVADESGQRTVHIRREAPGETCAVTEAITSPFHIVRVSKTSLPIAREEVTVVNECP